MKDLFNQTLMVLNTAFHRLEIAVDAPEFVQRGNHSVFAYKDRSIEAAMIQKLARVVSGLAATSVLLQSGLYQEVGVMFRILDELGEDIQFLRLGTLSDGPTQLHLDFLDAFYMEEFDMPDDPRASSQKRPMIAREKIQAALANAPGNGINPSDDKEIRRTICKAYGGYIHAASERVLEMVEGYTDGRRPKYRLLGMRGTPRQMQLEKEAVTYYYRGLLCGIMVAGTLRNDEVCQELLGFRVAFELRAGMTEWQHPERLVQQHKRQEKQRSRGTTGNEKGI